jgi:hypothetical protein
MYLMISKRPINASLIQCIGAFYTPTCFGISKCHHQGVRYEHAEMVLNVVKRREGWELYIVTDGVMVGILLGEGSQSEKRVVFWRLLVFNQ